MHTILYLLKSIIAIVELPIINILHRSILNFAKMLFMPIVLAVKVFLIPFKLLFHALFGKESYELKSYTFRTLCWLSAVSWVVYLAFPKFIPNLYDALLAINLPINSPLQSKAVEWSDNALYEITRNFEAVTNVASASLVPIMGVAVSCLYVILFIYWIFILFFFGAVCRIQVVMWLWSIVLVLMIVETLLQVLQKKSAWIIELIRYELPDIMENDLKDDILDYLKFIVYVIPIVNVLAYTIMMKKDKENGTYRLKPMGKFWSSVDFIDCSNKVHSHLIV